MVESEVSNSPSPAVPLTCALDPELGWLLLKEPCMGSCQALDG
jgi:hypothetical protein